MKRNEALFFAVADRVEFDHESYLQSSWGRYSAIAACGTRGCVAGNALLLSGYRLINEDTFDNGSHRFDEPWHIRHHAAQLLGLSSIESDVLFCGQWEPVRGLSVPDALRLLGKGERLSRVTTPMALTEILQEQEDARDHDG